MRWLDRGLLILLVLGVWALVLRPGSLTAHFEDRHDCLFFWTGGQGELEEGNQIYIHSGTASVRCRHL